MKAAIVTAMHADPKDLTRRMRAMRKTVAEHDVKGWARRFLEVLADAQPEHHKSLRPSTAD
jgi:trehalose 6-phosphate synthase